MLAGIYMYKPPVQKRVIQQPPTVQTVYIDIPVYYDLPPYYDFGYRRPHIFPRSDRPRPGPHPGPGPSPTSGPTPAPGRVPGFSIKK